MNETDPFQPKNPTIIPQHYPLWVEEWHGEDYTHRPVIGWVWTSDGSSTPYLHPVVADELGAIPYESRPGQIWSIVDHKPEEERN